jgi:hypothetical protein
MEESMFRFFSVFIVGVAISLAGTVHGLSQTESAREPNAFSQLPSLSPSGFTLSDYRELKARDVQTAQLILQAMREAVFYAQESVGKPVLCASPMPIPGARLMEMFDEEITTPSNPDKRAYGDPDHVAFILIYALRKQGACR